MRVTATRLVLSRLTEPSSQVPRRSRQTNDMLRFCGCYADPMRATATRLVLSRLTKPLSQVPRRSSQTRTQPTRFDRAITVRNSRRSSKPYLRDYRDPRDHSIHPRPFLDPEIMVPPQPHRSGMLRRHRRRSGPRRDAHQSGIHPHRRSLDGPPSPREPVPFDKER
jgi:hypothetical protein